MNDKPCNCDFTCCPHCSHWPGPHPVPAAPASRDTTGGDHA